MNGHPIGHFAEVLFAFVWIFLTLGAAFFGGAWVGLRVSAQSKQYLPYGHFSTAGKVAGWIVGIALLCGMSALGHAIPGVGEQLNPITAAED